MGVRHSALHTVRCRKCLTLQVSFRKQATNHMALLRKINHKDKTSIAIAFREPTFTYLRGGATNHRALLRKINSKDTASYGRSPLCNCYCIEKAYFYIQN